MRIFHGLQNIGGMAGLLAKAQRELGYAAKSYCRSTGGFRFEADEYWQLNEAHYKKLYAKIVPQFDVFQFYFGESLSGPSLTDIPHLKALGKKVFFYFCH